MGAVLWGSTDIVALKANGSCYYLLSREREENGGRGEAL